MPHKGNVVHIEDAPEDFGFDTEDLDERLIETPHFLIDLRLIQLCEVGVGPCVAYFRR
jgi:hypothetical protein